MVRKAKVAGIAVVALLALLLSGCAGGRPLFTPTSPPESTPSELAVPWSDYADDLKPRIDDLKAAGDCAALRGELERADANHDHMTAETGHNNALLLGYIDQAMQEADCY